MRSGWSVPPSTTLRARLAPHVAAALVALALPATGAAAGFERDDTPLPAGLVGETGQQGTEQASSSGSLVRMIVGLAIVLAVIYGIYWLAKGYRKAKVKGQSDGRMDVVATTALGPSRSVHLIRVGDELVLVGSAEQSVTKLRVYDASETARLLPLLDSTLTEQRLQPLRREAGSGTRFSRGLEDLRARTVR